MSDASPLERLGAKVGPLLTGRSGQSGNRALWSIAVELLQLASSTLVFLILVRFMETDTYGELVALTALAFPALSVSALGTHFLLLTRSSRGGDLAEAWNRATTVGLVGPAVVAVVMIGLQPLILPNVSWLAYAFLFIGNLPFFWANELAVYLGVGTGRMRQAAEARAILVMARFGAVAWFAIWGDGRLVAWAGASTVSFAIGGLGALFFVYSRFGLRPSFDRQGFSDMGQGVPFAANSVSEGLVDASDKVLLTRFDHKEDAGLYGLGARIVQFGYLPLRILMRSFDAELFGAGKDGVAAALAVTRRMIRPGLGIAAVVGVGFLALADLVPVVAGDKYQDSVSVIRYLAVLPFIRMVQYLAGNTLSASGRQPWRLAATVVAMVTNLGLNIWLLRDGTWRTAIATTFVSELLLAGLLIAIVAFWVRREQTT
jgi:O-antigen/teichoic acid export membrane protein